MEYHAVTRKGESVPKQRPETLLRLTRPLIEDTLYMKPVQCSHVQEAWGNDSPPRNPHWRGAWMGELSVCATVLLLYFMRPCCCEYKHRKDETEYVQCLTVPVRPQISTWCLQPSVTSHGMSSCRLTVAAPIPSASTPSLSRAALYDLGGV